mgnify:CR=1 FL=1
MKDALSIARDLEQKYSTKQRDELRAKHPEIADGVEKVVEKAEEAFGKVKVNIVQKEQQRGGRMITEEDVNKALEWLVSVADKAAEARSNRLNLEDFSRTLKAEIMSEHIDEPVNAQERHAYADGRYKTHLDGLKVAIKDDEKYRWLKDAAIAKLDCWRTQQANLRGVK